KNNAVPVRIPDHAKRERYSEDLIYCLFQHRTPPIGTGFNDLDWPGKRRVWSVCMCFSGYVGVNNAFAETLKPLLSDKDWVLVINYHLALVPKLIRIVRRLRIAHTCAIRVNRI